MRVSDSGRLEPGRLEPGRRERRWRPRRAWFWSVVILGAVLGGDVRAADRACPAPTPEQLASETVLGGIVSVDGPWGDIVAIGLCDAALEAGVRLELRRHDRDLNLEQQYIQEFIAEQIDALIMVAKLEDASTPMVRKAVDAGIEVICLGGCLSPRGRELHISLFFESDGVELGYRSGSYLAHWVHSNRHRLQQDARGRVSIGTIHADMSNVSYSRGQGFRDAMQDMGLEWISAADLEAGDEEEAARVVRRIVEEYPSVQLIWTDNAENTIGALRELSRLKLPRPIYLFGTEMNPAAAAGLLDERDILQGLSSQITYEMSRQSVVETIELLETLDRLPNSARPPFRHRIMESRLYTRADRAGVERFMESARTRGLLRRGLEQSESGDASTSTNRP